MRKEKQLLLDEIKGQVEEAKGFIVTEYDKMTPKLSWDFSLKLAKNDSHFEVIKKRVFAKALEKVDKKFNEEELKGHIGIIFVKDDVVGAAKTVYNFSKENEGLLKVITAWFENKYISQNEVKELSELPSEDQLRAQFLGLLEAPMSQTLATMDSLLSSVIYCLMNKSQK